MKPVIPVTLLARVRVPHIYYMLFIKDAGNIMFPVESTMSVPDRSFSFILVS